MIAKAHNLRKDTHFEFQSEINYSLNSSELTISDIHWRKFHHILEKVPKTLSVYAKVFHPGEEEWEPVGVFRG